MVSVDYGSCGEIVLRTRLAQATNNSSFPSLEAKEALTEYRQTVLDARAWQTAGAWFALLPCLRRFMKDIPSEQNRRDRHR